MKVTVVGAGNVGTQIAVHCAEKGMQVILYTSRPDKIYKSLSIVNEEGEVIHQGNIQFATNNPEEAFVSCDLIFITLPAFCMKEIADRILPYVETDLKICLIPGTGGGECAFSKCLTKGAVLFGLQRVPSVARLVEYGKQVSAVGYKKELKGGALPADYTEECCHLISRIFDIKCLPLSNYLNITLTPSNPILHTTRLRTIFKDYKEGIFYDKLPLFYEEWSDESSELLLKCDEELQKICRKIENIAEIDLNQVVPLKLYYESNTVSKMTQKISEIPAFKGLKTPAIKVQEGYVPDIRSRYFTADFSYGLLILIQIAELIKVDVPNMISTMQWYYNIAGKGKEFSFKENGITDEKSFIQFYMC